MQCGCPVQVNSSSKCGIVLRHKLVSGGNLFGDHLQWIAIALAMVSDPLSEATSALSHDADAGIS